MADIVDPVAITFSDQVIRPLSDRLVGLDATIDLELIKWYATISPILAAYAPGDIIARANPNDGRTPLSKNDIELFVTQLAYLQTALKGEEVAFRAASAGTPGVISKPHVNVIMP